jgi:hypothetical protein
MFPVERGLESLDDENKSRYKDVDYVKSMTETKK